MLAKRNPEAFLKRLWALEDRLVRAGFKPMPPRWRATIERFYRSGKRRLVVRKGRRVYASTCVAPRLAVAEMLFGRHVHVHGSPPLVFAFLSVRRDEAAKRLRGVTAILDAVAERYTERGESVELDNRPAAFAVVTANHKTSVGDTVAFAWCDEVASWSDDALGANPAEEVVGRLAPALATLPDAKLFLVSSPLSTNDFHARQFDLGETPAQCVQFGETWFFNPDLTEEATHAEEPDQRRWLREWAARPQESALAVFDRAHVNAAFRVRAGDYRRGKRVLVLDPSSGRKDSYTWGICGWNTGDAGSYLSFDQIQGLGGRFWEQVSGDDIVARLVQLARSLAIIDVHADQRESLMLESAFSRAGLRYHVHDWTAASKPAAVQTVRRWFADDRLALPEHDDLRRELLNFEERITSGGAFTFGARGSGHDDYVALLITAAMAEGAKMLDGSPLRPRHASIPNPPMTHFYGILHTGDYGGTLEAPRREDGLIPLEEYRAMRPSPTTQALADAIGPEITRHFTPHQKG